MIVGRVRDGFLKRSKNKYNTTMNKLSIALRSRTVWTIVALFVLNGFEGTRSLMPEGWLPVVDAFLGLLAAYFRVNPRAGVEK